MTKYGNNQCWRGCGKAGTLTVVEFWINQQSSWKWMLWNYNSQLWYQRDKRGYFPPSSLLRWGTLAVLCCIECLNLDMLITFAEHFSPLFLFCYNTWLQEWERECIWKCRSCKNKRCHKDLFFKTTAPPFKKEAAGYSIKTLVQISLLTLLTCDLEQITSLP